MARILVIDDNRTNLDLMLYLLKAFGHETQGAAGALEGLERARKDRYDAVVCDILMPDVDGFEFARRVRADAELAGLVLVAVTALAMVGDRERLLNAGFDGYISKPIDPQRFVKQVEGLLPAAKQPQDRPIVLAVDDIQVNLDLMRSTLEPFGYDVREARSVSEARACLKTIRPALVLCDVHMPDGNGYELLEEVKADPGMAQIPFVFVSSTAWQTADRRRGMEAGATAFLLRPVEPGKLLAQVRSAVESGSDGTNSGR